MSRRFIAFILITLISFAQVAGQEVGVVLSGGGSKGLYHIGMLDALEHGGVPIDYVSGTSMGAIIAGLYAAGYSPAEMREIALSGDLERWVSGKIDGNHGAYFRQTRQYRQEPPFLTVRLNTENKEEIFHMPRSLIPTAQIDMAFAELFTPASAAAKGDFDNLMVPFLCVTSDVVNRRAVNLTSGDVGRAVRASMALPIAFSPVVDNKKLFYDGGLYDNFPWRPLLDRHNPDLIIGSICCDDGEATGHFNSLMDQAFLLSVSNTDYQLPEGNYTIQRDVPVGMLDFDSVDEVIQMGYDDTMAKMDSIMLSIESPLPIEYYENRRAEFREKLTPIYISEVKIEGLNSEQRDYVDEYMNTSFKEEREEPKDKRPFKDIKANLFSVLSTGDFASNYPDVVYDSITESYRLSIELETKPSLKLSLGGNLSSTPYNQLYIGGTYHKIGRVAQSAFLELYLGPMYNCGLLGGRTDFYMNKPLFVDYYYSFEVANMNHGNFGNLTEVDNTENIKRSDQHLSLGVGLPVSRRSMISLRTNIGADNYHYSAGGVVSATNLTAFIDRTRFQFAGAKFEYERNTLDDMLYPTRGSKINISAIGVAGLEHSYYTADAPKESIPALASEHKWIGARFALNKMFNMPSAKWFSLGLNIDCVYTNFKSFGNFASSMLLMPAYRPVQHSNMVYMPEYSAQRFASLGLMPTFNILKNLSLQSGFYSMLSDIDVPDEINALYPEINDRSMHYISQAALVYRTPVGPASLAFTKYGIEDNHNCYLTFNFGYTIFAPRGTFY